MIGKQQLAYKLTCALAATFMVLATGAVGRAEESLPLPRSASWNRSTSKASRGGREIAKPNRARPWLVRMDDFAGGFRPVLALLRFQYRWKCPGRHYFQPQ
jgi:hypothetical protein